MNDSPPASEPDASPTRGRLLRGVALAAVALVAVIVINGFSGGTVDEVSGDEVTAWQSRVELEQAMQDTAAAIGLDITAGESDSGSETCDRPDGGQGESYIVTGPSGPVIEDLDGALVQIRTLWEGRGWDVSTRQIGAVEGLSATIAGGSSLYVLSGPGGTRFNGETLCARIAGAPTETATS